MSVILYTKLNEIGTYIREKMLNVYNNNSDNKIRLIAAISNMIAVCQIFLTMRNGENWEWSNLNFKARFKKGTVLASKGLVGVMWKMQKGDFTGLTTFAEKILGIRHLQHVIFLVEVPTKTRVCLIMTVVSVH